MKIAPVALLSVGVLAGIMAATNPKPAAYNEFAAETMTASLQENLCNTENLGDWLGKLGQNVGETCEWAIGGDSSEAAMQALIEDSTKVRNYGLFTLYETTTPVSAHRSLGVFNRFIPL
ncbi:MAG: DUF4359 domain-containing protein [Cyanobacteria bacterium P01_A01_bin.105]